MLLELPKFPVDSWPRLALHKIITLLELVISVALLVTAESCRLLEMLHFNFMTENLLQESKSSIDQLNCSRQTEVYVNISANYAVLVKCNVTIHLDFDMVKSE